MARNSKQPSLNSRSACPGFYISSHFFARLLALAFFLSSLALADESLITLASPRGTGITQSYLWTSETASPKTIYLLFPGYPSVLNLRKNVEGEVQFALGGNFLIRNRALFAGVDSAAASMDAPSDERRSFEDGFRTTLAPAQDIGAAIDDMKQRFPQARVVVVGNSASTTGVAYLAKNLANKVDALVLTATITNANFRTGKWGLGRFDFGAIKQPLLFVHHQYDACSHSPYRGVANLGYPLITVIGQDPPQSDACQAHSAHGFWGRDAQVVQAIRAWVQGEPYPHQIE